LSKSKTLDLSRYYTPHSGQAPVHASNASTKVLEAARRSGKSRLTFRELLEAYKKAFNQKRGRSMVPRFHAWIVVPTFAQGQQTWHELLDLFPDELLRGGRDKAFDHSDKRVYLNGGPNWGDAGDTSSWGYGLVEIKSAHDPDTLQTVGLDFLWVMEAADISERAFEKLKPSTRSPGRLGLKVYEGIPALYDDHWFARAYDIAKEKGEGGTGEHDSFAYKMTYKDNPLMDKRFIKEIEGEDKDTMTEASWNRMYLAIRSESAAFFRKIDGCIAGDLLDAPIDTRRYVAGLDLGRSLDPSELLIGDKEARKVVAWFEWSNVAWTQQREEIGAIYEEWGLDELIFDATSMGGQMALDDFNQMGLPVRPVAAIGGTSEYNWDTGSAGRQWMLERLAAAVERNSVTWPATVKPLGRQLRQMQERKVGRGSIRVDHPPGEHDDLVWALQFMLMGCDDAAPVHTHVTSGYSGRYLPTSAEARQGGIIRLTDFGQKRKAIRDDNMLQRAREAGVEV
jgi:hypothetical protein